MTTTPEGIPCWYELGTSDLTAASAFYADVLGWTIADAGMPGMDYRLGTATDGGMVSGMMALEGGQAAPPPYWMIYFTTEDCDARVAAITEAGGTMLAAPADIPGTGRFAVVADPQGAAFGLLRPLPMDAPMEHPAFDQQAPGHGNWHELMSSDPEAGLAFYAEQFGWTKGDTMDMGEMGTYQIFGGGGQDLGGMMGLGNSPVSAWLPYFGSTGIDQSVERIVAGGGTIHHGPAEVPGGAWIALATDPQGAWFAVVGPR